MQHEAPGREGGLETMRETRAAGVLDARVGRCFQKVVRPTGSGRTESCMVGSLMWRSWLNLVGAEGCGFNSCWEGGSRDMSVDTAFRGLDEKEGECSLGRGGGGQTGETQGLFFAVCKKPAQRRCRGRRSRVRPLWTPALALC